MMVGAHAEPDSERSISTVTVTSIVEAIQTVFVPVPQLSTNGPSRYWPNTQSVGSFMPSAMLYVTIAVIGGLVGILIFGDSLIRGVTGEWRTRESIRGDLKHGPKFLLPWFFLGKWRLWPCIPPFGRAD